MHDKQEIESLCMDISAKLAKDTHRYEHENNLNLFDVGIHAIPIIRNSLVREVTTYLTYNPDYDKDTLVNDVTALLYNRVLARHKEDIQHD